MFLIDNWAMPNVLEHDNNWFKTKAVIFWRKIDDDNYRNFITISNRNSSYIRRRNDKSIAHLKITPHRIVKND